MNVGVNLILFLPMGMALPVIFEKRFNKLCKVIMIVAVIVIICEVIQFVTIRGSAENGDGAMLAAMTTQIPIRNFVQMSMGVFSPKMAEGLLQILNDDESTFIGFNKIFWRIGGALVKLPNLFKSI